MDLNNIQLTPLLASSWYRSSLVEAVTDGVIDIIEKPVIASPVVNEWKYLGNNKKNILLLVHHADATHLPDDELEFLTNLLTACKLNMDDVAIVNRHNHPQQVYKDYLDYFKSRVVLLFGIDPLSFGLPVDFPHFQVQPFANCTFLYCPALAERNRNELFKSKLWVCLKRIFNL